jgi:hypothetical protein
MAKLTAAARNKIPTHSFALPAKRAYPVTDKNHAKAALSMVSRFGSPSEKAKVRAKVHSKFPNIGKK